MIGKRNRRNKTHGICRRCGTSSYNLDKLSCVACGFPRAKRTD